MNKNNVPITNPYQSGETKKIFTTLKETQQHPKYPSLSQQFQELQVLELIEKISQPNLRS
jgi:hypothetical protein